MAKGRSVGSSFWANADRSWTSEPIASAAAGPQRIRSRITRLRQLIGIDCTTNDPNPAATALPCLLRLFLKQRLSAEPDLAGRIDVDDLHEDLLAFFELIPYILHPVIRDLRYVEQAISARHDFDKR